jgi:hypothetical protein
MPPHLPPLVCLITPGHVASTPRLVKEALALVGAGYRVHVVAGNHFPPAAALDSAILSAAQWTHTLVHSNRGPANLGRKIARQLARRLVRAASSKSLPWVARAHHGETLRLAAAAARTGAALFIGHCLAALPAAVLAARATSSRSGFDAEDFHDAETTEALSDPLEVHIRTTLSRLCLPEVRHFTAASPLIGRCYADKYGLPPPTTVLNVFPRAEAPAEPITLPPPSEARPARCYWFSQTIGPGRGLESTVAILARLRTPVELHLRGYPASGYAERLQQYATRSGLRRPLVFLPPANSSEMVRLAAAADLGLSVEESTPLNRAVCLTNKIFAYLLAGIPQLMSHTPAQAALAPELATAAVLGHLDRPDEIAARLDELLLDPARTGAARRHAWALGQSRYNWDVEKEEFLTSLAKALS